jgi:hypothetical protein
VQFAGFFFLVRSKKVNTHTCKNIAQGMEITITTRKATTKPAGKTVTVGLIQTAVGEDLAANMQKTEQKIAEAAKQGAQIICLQELYRSRYFPQEENVDVSGLPSPSRDHPQRLSRHWPRSLALS